MLIVCWVPTTALSPGVAEVQAGAEWGGSQDPSEILDEPEDPLGQALLSQAKLQMSLSEPTDLALSEARQAPDSPCQV